MSAFRSCAACRHVARGVAKSEQLTNATGSVRHFSARTSQRRQQAQATEKPLETPSQPSRPTRGPSSMLGDILQGAMNKTPKSVADQYSSMGLGQGRRLNQLNRNVFSKRDQNQSPGKDSGSSVDDLLQLMLNQRTNRFGVAEAEPQPPMRLRPTSGRTVTVDAHRGGDPAHAFRQLDRLLSRNKVRSDLFKQRFHERPGLRRKRLAYESKIRVFKDNFAKTVAMVRSMAKSGW